jgi:hypothetical protein
VRQALAAQLAQITPERLEQFNLLMQDSRSVQKLADQTLNDETVVTAENAEHLLNVMREATAEDLKEKHEAAIQAERASAQRNLDEKTSEIAKLSEQVKTLQDRQADSVALRENQLRGVVVSVNTTCLRIELIVTSLLLLLGVAGGINVVTGLLDPYRIWSVILFLGGVVGFIRLCFAILERPMRGLGTLLNRLCRTLARRRLDRLGLSSEFQRLHYDGGRASLPQREVLPR